MECASKLVAIIYRKIWFDKQAHHTFSLRRFQWIEISRNEYISRKSLTHNHYSNEIWITHSEIQSCFESMKGIPPTTSHFFEQHFSSNIYIYIELHTVIDVHRFRKGNNYFHRKFVAADFWKDETYSLNSKPTRFQVEMRIIDNSSIS